MPALRGLLDDETVLDEGSAVGLVGTALCLWFLAAFYWRYGIVPTSETLLTLSVTQYFWGFLVGVSLTVAFFLFLTRPGIRAWFEQHRRIKFAVQIAVAIAFGLHISSAIVSIALGLIVLAVGATIGRLSLYLNA